MIDSIPTTPIVYLPKWPRLIIGAILTVIFMAYGAMGGVLWLTVATFETAIRGEGGKLQLGLHHIFENTPVLIAGAGLGLVLGILWSVMVLFRTRISGNQIFLIFLRFLGSGTLWGLVAGIFYLVIGYAALIMLLGWSFTGIIFGLLYPPTGGLIAGLIGGTVAGLVSLIFSKKTTPPDQQNTIS